MRVPVDSAIELMATGVVGEAPAWAEAADGRRQRAGQARSDGGALLWQVEVIRRDQNFGADVTVVEMVTVPGAEAPRVPAMQPVRFSALHVQVTPRRTGGLSVRWDAESLATPVAKGGQS